MSILPTHPKPLLVLKGACLAFFAIIHGALAAELPHTKTQVQPTATAPLQAACARADFQTVLHAAPGSTEARAYWLARQWLQWPGAAPTGVFKLYHAQQGGIAAEPGQRVVGADGSLSLALAPSAPPSTLQAELSERFKFIGQGAVLTLQNPASEAIASLLQQQLMLVQEDDKGMVQAATGVQLAGVLDDLYAAAQSVTDLGATLSTQPARTTFKLWAPTARQVAVCLYPPHAKPSVTALRFEPTTGIWAATLPRDLRGNYYRYLVEVFVPGVGLVLNAVTDPYSVSLNADSKRSTIADLDDARLAPPGWRQDAPPPRVKTATDMTIYELHVRDFSINDATVPRAHRGKYLAFTHPQSAGMKHLTALSQAGLTDVHLLPVFDIATIPETGCVTPIVKGAADSEQQQATVSRLAAQDCFNWGYDPFHFNAPEGSYATDAADGARRIIEFRRMVMALHQAGLRVGMDVVYNHTSASGQHPQSVLDRIVPGYYHRRNAIGSVEQSTCCANTAAEHRMMGKLMIDSAALWVKAYHIDSFRFDLMGHQPRAAMLALQATVNQVAGRPVQLIGEGWNFGEVADGKHFVQASQLSLNGSGIGTFSDRARDALRGGGPADNNDSLMQVQGYINGLVYAPNEAASEATPQRPRSDLLRLADMVRVGLAGTLRDVSLTTYDGQVRRLADIDYNGQPAGYASAPGEVVNYVENHDNHTLFDINVYKLPLSTSRHDRARVQMLGAALTMFSQGIAYFHAGIDTLRSKSMDRNSYDSGDWFNRLDWRYQDNYFATGLPPKSDNGAQYPLIKPLLANPAIKPMPQDIAWARDAFRDLVKIRASSNLFRLPSTAEVQNRLRFYNVGPDQNPVVMVGHLNGVGYPGAGFADVLYLVNVAPTAQTLLIAEEKEKPYGLHPVHLQPKAADPRPAQEARYERASGQFTIPARTAVVFVAGALR